MALCLRCGKKWTPKKERPSECPKCKRYDWDKEKSTFPKIECRKCGWPWYPKSGSPKQCPRCHSDDWQREGVKAPQICQRCRFYDVETNNCERWAIPRPGKFLAVAGKCRNFMEKQRATESLLEGF